LTHKSKRPASRSHENATVESFRRAPSFAADYLNGVLADGDEQELMVALRRVAEAFGGISKLAGKAKLNATTLYRTLRADSLRIARVSRCKPGTREPADGAT
jgi:DNA-binding phage protein